MGKEILTQIINNFKPEKFRDFFHFKNDKFRDSDKTIQLGEDSKFEDGRILGEMDLEDCYRFIVVSFLVKENLSEKSSKKNQYEIGKKVLKTEDADAGIFIFYDKTGRFRFSLIYTNYLSNKRRDFSDFRRFTYFVSPDQTNKTFLQQIGEGDFSTLEKIKEAFSVEPLNKEFYKEIQTWFFAALDKIYFPDNKEETKPLHLIRLLSRLIFIWFLKQKGLISDGIFNSDEIKKIVKDFNTSSDSCNYYNAILQNLFFATLNQPIKERRWAFNEGYPRNRNTYGIKQLYRYEDKFLISTKDVINLFAEMPFINGGLFDCLDKENKNGKVIYVDGFSRQEKKQAKIPDYLFFSKKFDVDLSKYQIGSNQKARGLIDILRNYNFTIDEATPIDQEIALNPELLGKIFENLLAAYNPETATTARKATGSYYTPREIVEYMVHQSLLEYLKNQISDIPEEKLDLLLSYSDEKVELEERQKKRIVETISKFKIIDPACGSGAFLAGFLNKLVYVLEKIDLENKHWKKIQLKKLKEDVKKLSKVNEKEIEERFKEQEEIFNENLFYPDYARKLYLIENCIFGVDIQQIATQLSKLRFFISLIIDQKVNKNKENSGIVPLPNLDLKFITANTLIGLKDVQNKLLENENLRKFLNEIKEQYHRYFRAKFRQRKKKIREKIQKLEKELAENLKSTIKLEKKEELKKLKSEYKNLRKEIEKIKLEPERVQSVEQNKLFGGASQLRINLKQEKIKNKSKELKEIAKKIEMTKKITEGDTLDQIAKKILTFRPFDLNYSNPWFDPEWMFGITEGFDIVIGNPPYIQLQKRFDDHRKYADLYKDQDFETFDRTGDIYCLFYERGNQLLNDSGHLIFITSNKWMRAKYGERLRKYLAENTTPKLLIDLGPGVFESATVDTCILLFQKGKRNEKCIACDVKENLTKLGISLKNYVEENKIELKNFTSKSWIILSPIEQRIKEKIGKIGTPLKNWDIKINRGILTGFNKAFIIDGKTKDELINKDPKSAEIIKPILRGKDIKRYYAKFADKWLIFIPWHFPLHKDTTISGASEKAEKIFREQYPAIYEHLLQYKEKLIKRNKEETGIRYEWYALQRCAASYYEEFEKEKVVWAGVGGKLEMTFLEKGIFINAPANFFTGSEIKFLLSILNSQLISWFYDKIKTKLGKEGGRFYLYDFEQVPIPKISPEKQKPFIKLVDQILEITSQPDYNPNNPPAKQKELEAEIDKLVYKLYGLSEKERKIVEKYK